MFEMHSKINTFKNIFRKKWQENLKTDFNENNIGLRDLSLTCHGLKPDCVHNGFNSFRGEHRISFPGQKNAVETKEKVCQKQIPN